MQFLKRYVTLFLKVTIFNKPGVAGAVLQTSPLLIDSWIHNIFKKKITIGIPPSHDKCLMCLEVWLKLWG